MFKKIASVLSLTAIAFSLCSCEGARESSSESSSFSEDTAVSLDSISYPLKQSEDMGQEYIDSFVFLGESTTYHLKNRGVLSGGTDTTQVWGTKSGTLMLDAATHNCRIVYPETGEEIDISEAMRRKKPKYMLLTFGLNGASANISKGSEYFKSCYGRLIDTLLEASPNTCIILQSCFPVAKNMDMSKFSVNVGTLNEYIDITNSWAMSLAEERSLGYLNTAEILKNKDGALFEEYQVGDGYHLTKEAYLKIIDYIRNHGYMGDKE